MSLVGDVLCRLDVIKEMNQRLGYRNSVDTTFNPRQVLYVETNLIDLDDPVDSEATFVDPK